MPARCSATRASSSSLLSSSTSSTTGLSAMLASRVEREREGRAAVGHAHRGHLAAVPVDDALDGGQPDTGAGELADAVQPLEWAEQLLYVAHVEAGAVVAYEVHGLAVPTLHADLDVGERAARRVLP